LKGHDLPVKERLEQIKNNNSQYIKAIDYNSDAKSIIVHYHNIERKEIVEKLIKDECIMSKAIEYPQDFKGDLKAVKKALMQ
jgi:hypothetical protein